MCRPALWVFVTLSCQATAFVAQAPAGVVAQAGLCSAQRQLCAHAARTRHVLLLSQESALDADIPGVADVRLAGWRAGPKAVESAAVSPEIASSGVAGGEIREPECGDVVEFPLSDLAKREAGDGRNKGVAVIVSINRNRNDAWKLPEDILDKAELQVLCPDLEAGEKDVWMADELEPCAFAKLAEMRVLKSSFNGAMDKWKRWTITEKLSEGCGARDAEWEYDIV